MRAHEIMSRHVITIRADASVTEAIEMMLSHHIRGLPVTDAAGKLTGMLTEGDFLRRAELGTDKKRNRWLSILAGKDQIAIDFARQHGRKVGQVMSPNPIAIDENTELEQIVRLMESRNVSRFPVMRGDEIVGMVTRTNFINALATLSPDSVSYSDDDDQIRRSAIAALSQAAWHLYALNVNVREGVVALRGIVESENARKASIVAAENVRGVKTVEDHLSEIAYPPSEDEYGGGDFVSLQEEPSMVDDEPL